MTRKDYTIVPKDYLYDNTISLDAKAVMSMLYTLGGKNVDINELRSISADDVNPSVFELAETGYITVATEGSTMLLTISE